MTDEKRAVWSAYFEGVRRLPGSLVTPVVYVRDLGGDPPAEVAYCASPFDRPAAVTGFDVEHRAVWSRGVRFA